VEWWLCRRLSGETLPRYIEHMNAPSFRQISATVDRDGI
jgi:hypothetical protein